MIMSSDFWTSFSQLSHLLAIYSLFQATVKMLYNRLTYLWTILESYSLSLTTCTLTMVSVAPTAQNCNYLLATYIYIYVPIQAARVDCSIARFVSIYKEIFNPEIYESWKSPVAINMSSPSIVNFNSPGTTTSRGTCMSETFRLIWYCLAGIWADRENMIRRPKKRRENTYLLAMHCPV